VEGTTDLNRRLAVKRLFVSVGARVAGAHGKLVWPVSAVRSSQRVRRPATARRAACRRLRLSHAPSAKRARSAESSYELPVVTQEADPRGSIDKFLVFYSHELWLASETASAIVRRLRSVNCLVPIAMPHLPQRTPPRQAQSYVRIALVGFCPALSRRPCCPPRRRRRRSTFYRPSRRTLSLRRGTRLPCQWCPS
jgi:hypothetical protein